MSLLNVAAFVKYPRAAKRMALFPETKSLNQEKRITQGEKPYTRLCSCSPQMKSVRAFWNNLNDSTSWLQQISVNLLGKSALRDSSANEAAVPKADIRATRLSMACKCHVTTKQVKCYQLCGTINCCPYLTVLFEHFWWPVWRQSRT